MRGFRVLVFRARRWAASGLFVGVLLGAVSDAAASAGQLDVSFGGDGKATTNLTPAGDFASAVAVQANGKVVVAGGANFQGGHGGERFGAVRYNADGSLDVRV